MGRVTEEKIESIRKSYNADPHFKRVARKEGVDWRTVRKYGPSSEDTIQDRESTATVRLRTGSRKVATEYGQATSSLAFKLMKKELAPVDVAIKLGLTEVDYTNYRRQFLKLVNYHDLDTLYDELSEDGELTGFVGLFKRMKEEGMVKKSTEFVELLKGERDLRNVGDHIARKNNELNEVLNKIAQRVERLNSIGTEIKNAEARRDELSALNRTEDLRFVDAKEEFEDWKLALDAMNNDENYRYLLDQIARRIEKIVEKKHQFLDIYRRAILVALRSVTDRELLIQNAGERLVGNNPEQEKYTNASSQLDKFAAIQLKEMIARKGVSEFKEYFDDLLK